MTAHLPRCVGRSTPGSTNILLEGCISYYTTVIGPDILYNAIVTKSCPLNLRTSYGLLAGYNAAGILRFELRWKGRHHYDVEPLTVCVTATIQKRLSW